MLVCVWECFAVDHQVWVASSWAEEEWDFNNLLFAVQKATRWLLHGKLLQKPSSSFPTSNLNSKFTFAPDIPPPLRAHPEITRDFALLCAKEIQCETIKNTAELLEVGHLPSLLGRPNKFTVKTINHFVPFWHLKQMGASLWKSFAQSLTPSPSSTGAKRDFTGKYMPHFYRRLGVTKGCLAQRKLKFKCGCFQSHCIIIQLISSN